MMTFSLLLGLCYLFQLYTIPDFADERPVNSFLSSFSSKTAYRHSKLLPLTSHLLGTDKCKLVHINALFRHGTRNPSKEEIEKIKMVHSKITKSQGNSNLPKSFLNWKPTFLADEEKQLTSVGYEEMMHLGQRFRDKFDDIDGYFDDTRHMGVFATSVSRTRLSGTAFLQKFLRGKNTTKEITEMIKEKNDELRFFDNCTFYTKSVEKNKSSKIEYQLFSKGPEIGQIIDDIRQRWKLMDIDLNAEDIRSIYIMCGYEIANNVSSSMRPFMCQVNKDKDSLVCPKANKPAPIETSPLCSLLEPQHYAIFEYLYDLKHYWIKSYGRNINWWQSCDLMIPMLEQIVNAAEGHLRASKASKVSKKSLGFHLNQENHLRAAFWFGHAETVLPLATLLGLFNQSSSMTASAYNKRMSLINDPKERFSTFRVSNIAPFSGNIALELHHCPDSSRESDGYIITVRSNEKAVRWSPTNAKSYMSLDAFRKHLKLCSPAVYNHKDVCDNGKDLEIQ